MVAIIPIYLLPPIILCKYRRGNKSAGYKPRWEFSLPLEIAMWGVPAILVAIMSFFLWHSTHNLDPYKPIDSANPTENVQVVGLDWKWLFIYPDLVFPEVTHGDGSNPASSKSLLLIQVQCFHRRNIEGILYFISYEMKRLDLVKRTKGQA